MSRRVGVGRLGALAAGVALAIVLGAARTPDTATVTLSVNAGAGRHPISPYIYGLNYANAGLATAIQLPVERWGGNETDTYNWRLGSSNTGLDYYFENISDCFQHSGPCVPAYRTFISADRARGTRTLLTLPMMGYVARNAPMKHPFTCGFPVSVVGPQDSVDPYDANCGNGMHGGHPVPADPTRDGVVLSTSYYQNWLDDLTARYGTAVHGGVAFYELGNEPSLWSSTHRDMHPKPETATELWTKSRRLATLINRLIPTRRSWDSQSGGGSGTSAAGPTPSELAAGPTACTTSGDCANHGHLPTVEWFLRQFANYDRMTRIRHLDYLDLHYYAQGGTTPAVTRSLWDPTYTDPSWINAKIDLIPRMKRWVANYYPGTKLSLSEYNLSVSTSPVINALIQADTLGIFAREGLDLATRWAMPGDGNLIGDAYKIYRNYDGHHSKFGDTWISSTSSNQGELSVYGARRSSDGACTVLVINKTSSALNGRLRLSGFTAPATARTWAWSGSGGIVHRPATAIRGGGITATYPATSMTLYVISPRRPGG